MTETLEQAIPSVEIIKEIEIAAPIEIAFEAILAEVGPEGTMPGGKPFPLVLEAWPGGRWYRDLGNNAGHFWGHVQVIKPPTLIEICGPMFMSAPALNHIQYRLTDEGGVTRLKFIHRGMGQVPKEFMEGASQGWGYRINRVRETAERLAGTRKNGK